jgi:DNA-binding XRE family transcriptional regulator
MQKGDETMAKMTMEAARRNAGLTQEQIAGILGVSRASYNAWETGRVEMKPVYFLGFCQAVKANVDDIILPTKSTLSKP